MWLPCSNWEGQALCGGPCSSVGEKMVAAFLVSAAYLLHKVLSLRKAQVTDLERPSPPASKRLGAGQGWKKKSFTSQRALWPQVT